MAEDGEEVYVIEKIVDKRVTKDGRVKYFLKWKDYPETDNTWEWAGDLDCDDLVQAFEEDWKKKEAETKEVSDDATAEEVEEELKGDLTAAVEAEIDSGVIVGDEDDAAETVGDIETGGQETAVEDGGPSTASEEPSKSPNVSLLPEDDQQEDPFSTLVSGTDPLAGEGEDAILPSGVLSASPVEGATARVAESPEIDSECPAGTSASKSSSRKRKASSDVMDSTAPKSGFDKGYTVETIIGITARKTSKYAFLIKWKESDEPTLEDREVCNHKCPQKIIKFYEKRLVWLK